MTRKWPSKKKLGVSMVYVDIDGNELARCEIPYEERDGLGWFERVQARVTRTGRIAYAYLEKDGQPVGILFSVHDKLPAACNIDSTFVMESDDIIARNGGWFDLKIIEEQT